MKAKRPPLYPTWSTMKDRCHNPRSSSYAQYGARGISVCQRWRDSFRVFEADLAELGPKPPGTSLDRINNDGNYEPGNVRWATMVEQLQNTRGKNKPRFIAHKGETLLVSEWARRIGVDKQTLTGRLDRGWSVEKALETPVLGRWGRPLLPTPATPQQASA